MFFDYLKKITLVKSVTYEYTLSPAEVSNALNEIFINNNKQPSGFDITGEFISETEFEYHLAYNTTLRGVKAFSMYGVVIPTKDETTYITLTSQSKFTSNFSFFIIGLIALISLILFLISWDTKSLLLFIGMAFLAPRILRMYIDGTNSALLIRYKKYLHNAILDTYRLKKFDK